MGNWRIRNRLQFVNLKNAKIRFRTVVIEQWVVLGAAILRCTHPRDRLIEQPAKRGARPRSIVLGKNTPHHVLVDLNTERLRNLLRNPGTAVMRIAVLLFNDRMDERR